jgi:hypothetical protein
MKMKNSKTRLPLNSNLTGKRGCEKKIILKIKTRGKLTVTAFSVQLMGGDGGGRPLFP